MMSWSGHGVTYVGETLAAIKAEGLETSVPEHLDDLSVLLAVLLEGQLTTLVVILLCASSAVLAALYFFFQIMSATVFIDFLCSPVFSGLVHGDRFLEDEGQRDGETACARNSGGGATWAAETMGGFSSCPRTFPLFLGIFASGGEDVRYVCVEVIELGLRAREVVWLRVQKTRL